MQPLRRARRCAPGPPRSPLCPGQPGPYVVLVRAAVIVNVPDEAAVDPEPPLRADAADLQPYPLAGPALGNGNGAAIPSGAPIDVAQPAGEAIEVDVPGRAHSRLADALGFPTAGDLDLAESRPGGFGVIHPSSRPRPFGSTAKSQAPRSEITAASGERTAGLTTARVASRSWAEANGKPSPRTVRQIGRARCLMAGVAVACRTRMSRYSGMRWRHSASRLLPAGLTAGGTGKASGTAHWQSQSHATAALIANHNEAAALRGADQQQDALGRGLFAEGLVEVVRRFHRFAVCFDDDHARRQARPAPPLRPLCTSVTTTP